MSERKKVFGADTVQSTSSGGYQSDYRKLVGVVRALDGKY